MTLGPHDIAQLEALLAQPEALLDALDKALETADPADLPLVDLAAEDDEALPYREVVDGRPRHRVVEVLLIRHREWLVQAICRDLDYCAWRKRHAPTIEVAKAVCDSLLSAALNVPIPATTLSAYCLQSLLLDRICECSAD